MELPAVALWDAGSTLCFITFQMAKQLKLQGEPVKLDIITVGGESKEVESQRYTISIRDTRGSSVSIEVLGIEQISTEIEGIFVDEALNKFKNAKAKLVDRPINGQIDILIGFQYAAYHPERIEAVGHMLLMQNRFGVILAGAHPNLAEKTKTIVKHATVLHVYTTEEQFYTTESLGVSCTPQCGACKCGTCHIGGKNMTIREEKELRLIEEGLSFDEGSHRWIAKYPWIKTQLNCLIIDLWHMLL